MPYSITCFTKILTLAKPPLLLILVGVYCEFAMVPGVYILLSPQEEEEQFLSWRHRCTHSAVHSSKRFKPLPAITLLWPGHCWIGQSRNVEVNCVYGAYNLTKWPVEIPICFWFQWMSLSNIFLIKFENLLVLYLGCGCMVFNLTTQRTLRHLSALTHTHE